MYFTWVKKIALAATLLVSSNSFAGQIIDTIQVNKLVNSTSPVAVVHNVLDNGFILGTATSAILRLEIKDDSASDTIERASIFIGLFDSQDDVSNYNAITNWKGNLGSNSLAILNATGLIDVGVFATLGDFIVTSSSLTVTTITNSNVPEPGSLILLGFGLLGLGLARRKQ